MRSMTGFGRGEATDKGLRVRVELLSVNRKQADIVVNLPRNFASLEIPVRKLVASQVARGRVTVQIVCESTNGSCRTLEIDKELAVQYRNGLNALAETFGTPLPLEAADLLRANGVFSLVETALEPEAVWPVIQSAVESGMQSLNQMRDAEGAHLKEDLAALLGSLRGHLEVIRDLAPKVVEHHRQALHRRLNEAGISVDLHDERLIKEVGIFADRCDISEETVRLGSHLKQFEAYLDSDEPKGRAMDFLAQELHREFNTIGAKASNAEIAQHVVHGKTEVEKLREQVQNIE